MSPPPTGREVLGAPGRRLTSLRGPHYPLEGAERDEACQEAVPSNELGAETERRQTGPQADSHPGTHLTRTCSAAGR